MNLNETDEGLKAVTSRFFTGVSAEESNERVAAKSGNPLISYQQGDLFSSGERVIAHGCNCVGVMGKGVAKLVATKYPLAKKKYQAAIKAKVFNLGYAQFVLDEENDICIYNLGTQKQPGPDATKWGIFLAFCNMYEHAHANNITRIAIPKIGSGIGGLDWDDVLEMINLAWLGSKYDIQIVVYEL